MDFIYQPLSVHGPFWRLSASDPLRIGDSLLKCHFAWSKFYNIDKRKKLKSHKNILKHIIFSLVAAVNLHIFEVYFKENINIVDYFRNQKKVLQTMPKNYHKDFKAHQPHRQREGPSH